MRPHIASAIALLIMIVFACGSINTETGDREPGAMPQNPRTDNDVEAQPTVPDEETPRNSGASPGTSSIERKSDNEQSPRKSERTKSRGVAPLHVTELAGKSVDEVNAVLGEPVGVTAIRNFPEDMPGDLREYQHGDFAVTVQFLHGHAIAANIDLRLRAASSSDEALRYAGLRPAELTRTFETPEGARTNFRVIRWRGIVDGVDIEDVTAVNTGAAHHGEPARYTVHFEKGKDKVAVRYEEDGDSYQITFEGGGTARYPKSMVERIDPIDEWVQVAVHFPRSVARKAVPTTMPRNWTDSTGKHHTEAELVSVENGEVTLKRANGKTMKIPLEKLSDADRELAKQWKGKSGAGKQTDGSN